MLPLPEEVDMLGSGIAGWVGTGIAAAIAAVLGLRRWLSGDASARAEDAANVEFLKTLMDQLDKANSRADRFAQERNEAVAQIGELKAQIALLQATVNHMQSQLNAMISAKS